MHVMSRDDVQELLDSGGIVQALHAAPLWKYMSEHPK